MIKKITSKKVVLPPIYLVENEDDFKELPKGLPYIIAKKEELSFVTIFLEFQVLYKSCMKTNIPIKWLDCLKRVGYKGSLREFTLQSGGEYFSSSEGDREISADSIITSQYLVDFDRLSELKILPVWLEDLKASVQTNIIDEVTFNPMAFNKQLGLNTGASAIKHNMRNLIILDVSGSIPEAIVKTITSLAKLMSKRFYADIMITSGKTQLIDYDVVPESDIINIARSFGSGNEGEMYAKIIKENKEYNTVICFGDDDSPKGFMRGSTESLVNNFKVNTLYSLHTKCKKTNNLAGYCRVFEPKTTIRVDDWVNTIL